AQDKRSKCVLIRNSTRQKIRPPPFRAPHRASQEFKSPRASKTLLLSFDLDFYLFCLILLFFFPIQSIELLRTRCRSVLNRPSREEIPNGYELSAGNCTRSQPTFRVVL
ncbi:MAG: hypothetical protein J3Q66DRAFT_383289, partial [Benniella sp.]